MQHEPDVESGWIEQTIAAEFPDLTMRYAIIDAKDGPTGPDLYGQLLDHAGRLDGTKALALPTRPFPASYRSFFRHIGLDPDAQPTPVEAVAQRRMLRGTFESFGVVTDALVIATMDTHVCLGVLDADELDGPLGIRLSRADDPAGPPPGTLVISDAEAPVAPLFGVPVRAAVGSETSRIAIHAIGVPGVPGWMLDHAIEQTSIMIQRGGL